MILQSIRDITINQRYHNLYAVFDCMVLQSIRYRLTCDITSNTSYYDHCFVLFQSIRDFTINTINTFKIFQSN